MEKTEQLLLEKIRAALEALAEMVAERLKPYLQQPMRPRLLSIDQAAIYLGRTPEAVRGMVNNGKLTVVRADNRIMFDINDLDQWIEVNKTER